MAVVINGTTGITNVNGSASAPAETGTDTDTGLWFPAANTLAWSTGGTEAMRIDSSQNVGIGTSSPSYRIDAISTGGTQTARFRSGDTATTVDIASFERQDSAVRAVINYNSSDGAMTYGTSTNHPIAFKTNNTEKARIDTSGRLTVPNQPCFTVYGSTTQSWSGTAAYQIIQFNTKYSSLNDAGFNTGTYTYTAPVTGRYLISLKITQSTTVTGPSASIYVNGSAVGAEMVIAYTTAYMSSSATVILYLAANDAVTARAINFNNVSMSLDLSRCLFSGYLIG